jgi:hypothetical protein
MSDRLSLSIFTIEVDGKPRLAFEAKRYSEARQAADASQSNDDDLLLVYLVELDGPEEQHS